MRIAYNPKTAQALVSAPDNEDITFDLSGLAIYVKGVKFEGKVYSVFKKHTLNTTGGYDGLVPAPSYTETITRFLREDGTWVVPTNTTYTFTNGTTGNFTVTPSGGTAQTVSIGKPATAGDADTVDGYSLSMFGHFKDTKTVFDTTNSTWYIKVDLNLGWNNDSHHLFFRPYYNNIAGHVELEIPTWDDTEGYIIKTSSYNLCNISGIRYIYEGTGISVYLRLNGYMQASCVIYSTCTINSASVISKPDIDFIDVKSPAIQTNYSIYAPKLYGTAEKADKLSTPRTIWGQSFDGSANVSGIAYFPNGDLIYAKDEGGTYRYVMGLTSGLSLGYGSAAVGIDTYILGKNIHFRYYDTDYKYAMSIKSNGNVGIGTTAPQYKLDVNGDIRASNNIGFASTMNSKNHYLFVRDDNNANWVVTDKLWQHEYNLLHSGNLSTYFTNGFEQVGNTIKISTSYITDKIKGDGLVLDESGKINVDSSKVVTISDRQIITGAKIFDPDKFILTGVEYNDIKHSTQKEFNWGGFNEGATPAWSGMYNTLDFLWYGHTWSIGNIRGGGDYSEGFGIGKKTINSEGKTYFKPALRVTETETYINNNKAIHEGNIADYVTSLSSNADTVDGLHWTSFGVCHSSSFYTDKTTSDVTSTSMSDFITRLNYSGLFNTCFGMCRGSWYYVAGTQYNTGVGTLEMAGTAVLNMSASTSADEHDKTLLFIEGSSGNLYSYVKQSDGYNAIWSRYVKTTDKIANASWADGAAYATTAGNATTASYCANFGTSSSYVSYDLDTNNTADTWVPVMNNGKLQHRVIPTAYNNAPSTLSVNYANSAGSAGSATATRYIQCPDTRSTAFDIPNLDATTSGISFDFKQNSITGLSASYSGVMTYRPYSYGGDWSGGPAHLLAFDQHGIHHRTYNNSGFTTWKTVAYTDHTHAYLPLAGGTMDTTALILAYTRSKGSGDIYNSAILLREATGSGTACADNMYDAPGITFHWSGRWVHKLNMHSNALYWDNSKLWHDGNDGSGSGLDADVVDGYHIWVGSSSSLPSTKVNNTIYILV